MELIKLMEKRRSIRKYTDDSIPDEKLEAILNAALLAPTSMGKRPWEFYVVRDRDRLERLAKAKHHGAGLLTGCSAAVIVFADSTISDVWIEDCSIALAHMHLMAVEQGVGSCWVQMRLRKDEEGKDAEKNVSEIMGVGEPYRLVGMMALGMPGEEKDPILPEQLDREKIHFV